MDDSPESYFKAELDLIKMMKKMIRKVKASPKDIANKFGFSLSAAQKIHEHLSQEMKRALREDIVRELHQLTHSQEIFVRHIMARFNYLSSVKLSNIMADRIDRRVSKSLIMQLKRNNKYLRGLDGDNLENTTPQKIMAGLEYLVDVETANLNTDIIYLKNKTYNFIVTYKNNQIENKFLKLNNSDDGTPKSTLTIDYVISIVIGQNKNKFVGFHSDRDMVSNFINLFEKIKNQFLNEHKYRVTIVSEKSSYIMLAYNHVARCSPNFTFKHIILPPEFSSEENPVDGAMSFVEDYLSERGEIRYPKIADEIINTVDNYLCDDFDYYFENHLRQLYKIVF